MTLYHQLQEIYVLLDDGDRRTLAAFDLTPTQYNLLARLGNGANHPTITEIADMLLCTRGNVTRLVRRMQDSGLVLTSKDDNDQRLLRVLLTAKGKQRLQAAQELHHASIQRRIGAIGPEALEALGSLVEILVEQLRADLTVQN